MMRGPVDAALVDRVTSSAALQRLDPHALFDTADLARYLHAPTRDAAWTWAKRHGLRPAIRRGRLLFYRKLDIDAAWASTAWSVR